MHKIRKAQATQIARSLSTTTPKNYISGVLHPSVKTKSVETPVIDTSVPIYALSESAVGTDKELYHRMAKSFSRLLKINNPSLIANLIDQSAMSLYQLII